jgi:hypothetical protein
MSRQRGRQLLSGNIGIIVAGDMPENFVPALEASEVMPIAIVFAFKDKRQDPFEVPCRPPNGVEVCLLVNRALVEGKIEFGFRAKDNAGPIVTGGN